MPVCSMISRPTTVLGSWKAGRQCMNLTVGFPVLSSSAGVDLVRREQPDPLGPDVLGLAHRDPDVGVDEVDAGDGVRGVVGDRDAGAGAAGDVLGDLDDVLGRVQLGRPGQPDVAAHQRAHDQQRAAHVEAAVADERVGEPVVGLVAGLVHGEEVGQHLGGMPLVGQPVVDRHARRAPRGPRRRPARCRGTRSRRTSGRGRRRCRRPTPCAPAGSRTGRGRSRARPGRRRRPRTPTGSGSRSSRR